MTTAAHGAAPHTRHHHHHRWCPCSVCSHACTRTQQPGCSRRRGRASFARTSALAHDALDTLDDGTLSSNAVENYDTAMTTSSRSPWTSVVPEDSACDMTDTDNAGDEEWDSQTEVDHVAVKSETAAPVTNADIKTEPDVQNQSAELEPWASLSHANSASPGGSVSFYCSLPSLCPASNPTTLRVTRFRPPQTLPPTSLPAVPCNLTPGPHLPGPVHPTTRTLSTHPLVPDINLSRPRTRTTCPNRHPSQPTPSRKIHLSPRPTSSPWRSWEKTHLPTLGVWYWRERIKQTSRTHRAGLFSPSRLTLQ